MALEEGEGSASRPGRYLPPGKTRYPLYGRLDGPQGRSGQVRKISSPPGFDPRIVKPVASRYTEWAIAAHKCIGDVEFEALRLPHLDTRWRRMNTSLSGNVRTGNININ